MTTTGSTPPEVTGEDKPRRYRFGYWAVQLEVLITGLSATGTLMIGLSAGGGNGGVAVAFGVTLILVAFVLGAHYRHHYVEIDTANKVVRLSRLGDVSEYSFDQVVFVIPQRAWTFPRAVRLETREEGVNCPLCHQGQLIASPRARRFTETLSTNPSDGGPPGDLIPTLNIPARPHAAGGLPPP